MAIVKRGEKYGVRVWVDGRHRWLGTFATRAEAKRAEADATIQPVSSSSMTVEQWARIWLERYERPAAATQRTYRYAIEQVIRDVGSLRLAAVDRPTARAWANTWPRGTTRTARTMWADALRDGVCQQNPFTNLRLETPKGRKDLIALTEPEIARLTSVARDTHGDYGDEMAAIILFAAYTGVRPGELAAMRWTDLDPANRQAVISRALDGQGGEKAPKNGLALPIVLPPAGARGARHDHPSLRLHVCIPLTTWEAAEQGLAQLPVAPGGRRLAGSGWPRRRFLRTPACLRNPSPRARAEADRRRGPARPHRRRTARPDPLRTPDEERALDRLLMAFSVDGHKSQVAATPLGQDPAAGL